MTKAKISTFQAAAQMKATAKKLGSERISFMLLGGVTPYVDGVDWLMEGADIREDIALFAVLHMQLQMRVGFKKGGLYGFSVLHSEGSSLYQTIYMYRIKAKAIELADKCAQWGKVQHKSWEELHETT